MITWDVFERYILFISYARQLPKTLTSPWSNIAFARWQICHPVPLFYPVIPPHWKEYAQFQTALERITRRLYITLVIVPICLCMLIVFAPLSWSSSSNDNKKSTLIAVSISLPLAILFIILIFVWARFLITITTYVCTRPRIDRSDDNRASTLSRELLDGMYGRHAREPKDMAFGMWSILKRFSKQELPEVNHSDDIGTIYRTFASFWMITFKSLDLLFLAAAKGVHGQPSWVPDLAGYGRHIWASVTDTPSSPGFPNTDASDEEGDSPLIEFDDARSILSVHAYHVATATMCIKARYKVVARYPNGVECEGKCSVDAQEGDHIIHVSGIRQLVLVRRYADHEYDLSTESPRAVTVISPVVLDAPKKSERIGQSEKTKGFFWSKKRVVAAVSPQLNERQYVRYDIH